MYGTTLVIFEVRIAWCSIYSGRPAWHTCKWHVASAGLACKYSCRFSASKNWQKISGYLGSEELVVALAGQCWTYSFTLVKVVAEDIQALHNNHSSNDSIGGGNSWNNVTSHGWKIEERTYRCMPLMERIDATAEVFKTVLPTVMQSMPRNIFVSYEIQLCQWFSLRD